MIRSGKTDIFIQIGLPEIRAEYCQAGSIPTSEWVIYPRVVRAMEDRARIIKMCSRSSPSSESARNNEAGVEDDSERAS